MLVGSEWSTARCTCLPQTRLPVGCGSLPSTAVQGYVCCNEPLVRSAACAAAMAAMAADCTSPPSLHLLPGRLAGQQLLPLQEVSHGRQTALQREEVPLARLDRVPTGRPARLRMRRMNDRGGALRCIALHAEPTPAGRTARAFRPLAVQSTPRIQLTWSFFSCSGCALPWPVFANSMQSPCRHRNATGCGLHCRVPMPLV